MAVIALVSMNIFLKFSQNPKDGFTAIEIQEIEKESSGQILAIEDIDSVISDIFYLGYLSRKGDRYSYDMSGRDLQIGG